MPAQEVNQPQSQQMEMTAAPASSIATEQPRSTEHMTAEPMSMRGGGNGGICCGICAGIACFECCECCC